MCVFSAPATFTYRSVILNMSYFLNLGEDGDNGDYDTQDHIEANEELVNAAAAEMVRVEDIQQHDKSQRE